MAASWGKRATTRIDRTQFDKDELLQSLGNQFNVDFADYDKWKRKASLRRPMPVKEGTYSYILISVCCHKVIIFN